MKIKKCLNRVLSGFLASVMVLGLAPLMPLKTAEAASSDYYTWKDKKNDPEWSALYREATSIENLINGLDLTNLDFRHTFTDIGSILNPNTPSSWMDDEIQRAAARGIVKGDNYGNWDPTLDVTSKVLFHIANQFYFTKSIVDGSRVVESNPGNDYANAERIFNEKTTGSKLGIPSKFTSQIGGQYLRGQMFVVAAFLRLGTQTKTYLKENYSGDKLGYRADGKTKINGFNSFVASDIDDFKYLFEPNSDCPLAIRSVNLLMDEGIVNGTGKGLSVMEPITKVEWFAILSAIAEGPNAGNGQSGGGGGWEPDPEPDPPYVNASLSMSASNASINYKDFANGATVTVPISLNASRSDSNYSMSFDYTVSSRYAVRDMSASGSDRESVTMSFTAAGLGYDGGNVEKINGIPVSGQVRVSASGASDVATSNTSFDLYLTNEAPDANLKITSDCITDPSYADDFFYAGEPITILDQATDYENEIARRAVVIRKNGAPIGVLNDWDDPTSLDKNSYLTDFSIKSDKTLSATFRDPGTYVIEETVWDVRGVSDNYSKTIIVTDSPAPPDAIIRTSSDYIFKNCVISYADASTDPNNDIVKWTWGNIISHDLDEDGNDLGTTKPATGMYSGSLASKVLAANGSNASTLVGGSITFNTLGKFSVDLSVEDATKFTDKTTKTIEVIDNVPVIDVEVDGGDDISSVDDDIVDGVWEAVTGEDDEHDPHVESSLDKDSGFEYPEIDEDLYEDFLIIKENRLVHVDTDNSLNPPESGIIDEQTEWEFEGAGDFVIGEDLLFDEKNCGDREKTFQATRPGIFFMTITLHNEYSDNLAKTDPDNKALKARTKTIVVQVLPDTPPEVSLSVNNANPNFNDNPSKVTVDVSSIATSLDNDIIDKYYWKVVRDMDEDGDFTDEKPVYEKVSKGAANIGIPVQFSNSYGKYNVSLVVDEIFGQTTKKSFLNEETAYRSTGIEKTFDVNWTPSISFRLPSFAYTDDVITISTVQKDEKIEDCTVAWEILRSNTEGGSYTAIDKSELTIGQFTNALSKIQFSRSGYYVIKATITDLQGNSSTFTSSTIRIYGLPQAVISDDPQYRWQGTPWTYKEARKFVLTGENSVADDDTGTAMHPINHSLDVWSITPLNESITADSILVQVKDTETQVFSDSSVIFAKSYDELNEQLAILEPGQYKVSYQVTNTHGKKSAAATAVITIVEDTAPVITGTVPEGVDRGTAAEGSEVSLVIQNLVVKSDDADQIEDLKIEVIYDAENDGTFLNNQWETLKEGVDYTFTRNTSYIKSADVSIRRSDLGCYQFRVSAKDKFGQETLSIVPESEIKSASKTWDTKVDNSKPSGTFTLRNIAKGDIVFAVGQSSVADYVQAETKNFANRFLDEATLDIMDVHVEVVETSTMTSIDNFPWQKDLSGSVGSINFTNGGSSINIKGNESNPGKNCLYYIPTSEQSMKQVFGFDYSLSFGDSISHAGVFLNVSKTGNTIQGYLLAMNNHLGSINTHGIYQFSWNTGTNSSQISNITLLQSLNLQTSGHLNVTLTQEQIVVTGTGVGNQTITVDLPQHYGYGLGFYAEHYSHGCSQIGNFDINNITLQQTTLKTLAEALSDVSWRDGAERFVIYVDDEVRAEMDLNDKIEHPLLMAKLLGENIHLITLGSTANQTQQKTLIRQLSKESNFYLSQPPAAALTNAEQFIKSILLNISKYSNYVLLNEEQHYTKYFTDGNGDPQWLYGSNVNFTNSDWATKYWTYVLSTGVQEEFDYPTTPSVTDAATTSKFKQFKQKMENFWSDPSILAQRWKYYHEQQYFDNPLGDADFMSTSTKENWLREEVTIFDKTGRYLIDYQIKDNPVANKLDNEPSNPFHSFRYWSQNYANNNTNINGVITNPYETLYVHRRPVAKFTAVPTITNQMIKRVTITQAAYDLDHEDSRPDKGLNLFEWKWKYSTSDGWTTSTFTNAAAGQSWINSQLSNVNATDIMIQYRVRDIDGPNQEGVWSEPNTIWVSSKPQPPIAHFATNNNTYDVGEKPTITDSSYSPNGYPITNWKFTVTRPSNKHSQTYNYTGSPSSVETNFARDLFNFLETENRNLSPEDKNNKYKITLEVTDSQNRKSDPYSVTITIVPGNTPPVIAYNNNSIWVSDNPTVYEYDAYDANLTNPYYSYGGAAQKRGQEYLDWSLRITDPDNNDNYGTANNSDYFKIAFAYSRSAVTSRNPFGDVVGYKSFAAKQVNAGNANPTNNTIAPFTTAKQGNLTWGAYQIEIEVTDHPINGKTPKSTTATTYSTKKAFHLYVIPALSLGELHFNYNGILDNPEQITPGETIVVTAETNDRSTGARIVYRDGAGVEHKQELRAVSMSGETVTWSGNFQIPDDLEEDDLDTNMRYYFDIETYTTYGAKNGEETRSKKGTMSVKILPVKLYDFSITGVTDPSVDFERVDLSRFDAKGVVIPNLAFDTTNANNTLMSQGYAFEFKVFSKGLQKNTDSVRINASFYGQDATGNYTVPLDMYYISDGKYVKMGDPNDRYQITASSSDKTVLGGLSELNLPITNRVIEGSTQYWTGRYGIPGTAVFVRHGEQLSESTLWAQEGDLVKDKSILVCFSMDAMKNGVAKYNYVAKNQWAKEFLNDMGAPINPNKAIYNNIGVYGNYMPVFVFNPMDNALSNYETRPVWTKD